MPRKNLIIIHRGSDYERDFDEIADKVIALDRSITVYHLSAGLKVDLPEGAWDHPTLTVALCSNFLFQVRRGPILKNGFIGKLEQAARVRAAGLPAPAMEKFVPGMKLDPLTFGEFVIIKPMTLTSRAQGVQLFRRQRLEQLTLGDFPGSHPIHHDKDGYLVQRFIDTGPCPWSNRVTTFLGRPIYAAHYILSHERPPLTADDAEIEAAKVAIQGGERRREWYVTDDVMARALEVSAVFPEIPLLAIDLLREESTGELHFLECNPGGNTWHFSSRQPGGINLRHQLGQIEFYGPEVALERGRQKMIEMFGAFDVAARGLVEKTNTLAA